MKKIKNLLTIMLAIVMVFTLVACESSLSLTIGVETGDKIKVKLDTSDDLSMKWDKNENVLKVSDDDRLVLSMYFSDASHLTEWIDGATGATNVDVKENGSGNGTKRSIVFVDSADDGVESASYIVAWIVGSNTGLIVKGTDSNAETKEVFESLTFSIESTDQDDEYYFLESVVMKNVEDTEKQPAIGEEEQEDDETEPVTEPIEDEEDDETEPEKEDDETDPSTTEPEETESKGEPNGDTQPADVSEISDDWRDLDIMIDGVLYHFPYDYDKLVENGWTIDMTDYGYEDGYILNKGEKTTGTLELHHEKYGKEYSSFSIDCGFQNFEGKAVDITECDLWSIKLDCIKYSSPHEEYSEVKIAKGIGFGSTKEDVIAAFGECEEENIYESTELGYVTYEYVNDYNQHMRFTIYEEFGVTCIELKNYGA
jgi:hypothetical protein